MSNIFLSSTAFVSESQVRVFGLLFCDRRPKPTVSITGEASRVVVHRVDFSALSTFTPLGSLSPLKDGVIGGQDTNELHVNVVTLDEAGQESSKVPDRVPHPLRDSPEVHGENWVSYGLF